MYYLKNKRKKKKNMFCLFSECNGGFTVGLPSLSLIRFFTVLLNLPTGPKTEC